MSIENKCHSFLVKAKHSVKKIVLTYRRIAAQIDHVTEQHGDRGTIYIGIENRGRRVNKKLCFKTLPKTWINIKVILGVRKDIKGISNYEAVESGPFQLSSFRLPEKPEKSSTQLKRQHFKILT